MFRESINPSPDFGEFNPASGNFAHESEHFQENETLAPEQDEEIEALKAKAEEIKEKAYSEPKAELLEKMQEFSKENPDVRKYELYHVLIGSSVPTGEKLEFDTEDHKIERFIREDLDKRRN